MHNQPRQDHCVLCQRCVWRLVQRFATVNRLTGNTEYLKATGSQTRSEERWHITELFDKELRWSVDQDVSSRPGDTHNKPQSSTQRNAGGSCHRRYVWIVNVVWNSGRNRLAADCGLHTQVLGSQPRIECREWSWFLIWHNYTIDFSWQF